MALLVVWIVILAHRQNLLRRQNDWSYGDIGVEKASLAKRQGSRVQEKIHLHILRDAYAIQGQRRCSSDYAYYFKISPSLETKCCPSLTIIDAIHVSLLT